MTATGAGMGWEGAGSIAYGDERRSQHALGDSEARGAGARKGRVPVVATVGR